MLPTFLLHIISAIMTFFQEALLLKGDPAMRSQAPAGEGPGAALPPALVVAAPQPASASALAPLRGTWST